ncbi:response regulator [Lysobacter sp. LF1]|uniref:Response regulator n=1 Tax=Lysobacter stagni TaxID=3045172 RepID=A0ABT6XGV1_9GAMM|nr:response regulator [Lysobacter sp. LF1]MDI9239391.1 response regulator [Lysobacter sp. LF1]
MPATLPRILLVEDDPTSRSFLTAALQATPAEVDAADSVAAAIALAASQDYSAWMIDARLPDGTGEELLARLRAHHPHTPALAHTAAHEATTLDALVEAGFVEALTKPMPASAVQGAVRRLLGLAPSLPIASIASSIDDTLPLWDEEAAVLALNGNRTHVDTLRGLFVHELPNAVYAIAIAAERGDLDSVRNDLHRLRASCGFVGAQRMAAAVHSMQDDPASAVRLQVLERVAQDTLAHPSATAPSVDHSVAV